MFVSAKIVRSGTIVAFYLFFYYFWTLVLESILSLQNKQCSFHIGIRFHIGLSSEEILPQMSMFW